MSPTLPYTAQCRKELRSWTCPQRGVWWWPYCSSGWCGISANDLCSSWPVKPSHCTEMCSLPPTWKTTSPFIPTSASRNSLSSTVMPWMTAGSTSNAKSFHDSKENISSDLISCLTCRYPASSPTKLLCFTRSSLLIHQLPTQYPSSVIDTQTNKAAEQTLCDMVIPKPSQLVMCKLSSLLSQSSLKEMLSGFVQSKTAQVSFHARKILLRLCRLVFKFLQDHICEGYSIEYFNCIAMFRPLYNWTSRTHTCLWMHNYCMTPAPNGSLTIQCKAVGSRVAGAAWAAPLFPY